MSFSIGLVSRKEHSCKILFYRGFYSLKNLILMIMLNIMVLLHEKAIHGDK